MSMWRTISNKPFNLEKCNGAKQDREDTLKNNNKPNIYNCMWGSSPIDEKGFYQNGNWCEYNKSISEWHDFARREMDKTSFMSRKGNTYILDFEQKEGVKTIKAEEILSIPGIAELMIAGDKEQIRNEVKKYYNEETIKGIILQVDDKKDYDKIFEKIGTTINTIVDNYNVYDWEKIISSFDGFELTDNGYDCNYKNFWAWCMPQIAIWNPEVVNVSQRMEKLEWDTEKRKNILELPFSVYTEMLQKIDFNKLKENYYSYDKDKKNKTTLDLLKEHGFEIERGTTGIECKISNMEELKQLFFEIVNFKKKTSEFGFQMGIEELGNIIKFVDGNNLDMAFINNIPENPDELNRKTRQILETMNDDELTEEEKIAQDSRYANLVKRFGPKVLAITTDQIGKATLLSTPIEEIDAAKSNIISLEEKQKPEQEKAG